VRELIGYSLPLGVTDIIGMLRSKLDMWLIVLFFAAERVAEYQMGAWQIPIITTVAFSLGAVQLPRYAQLFQSGQSREALHVWRQSSLKVSLVVVPAAMVFIVAAEEFVSWAFTPEYIRAAGVFRCYCFLVMLRITDFGSFLMAAGRPGYVLRSAALTLLASAALAIPLVFTLGFIGPALGTALAIIPTLFFYCGYVARAAGVRITETFPLLGYLRVVAVAAVPAALAIAFKLSFDLHYIAMFWIEAVIVLVGWALLGTLLRLIEPEDWAFARRWARLGIFK
jgi:O-antigen/teichoic acid export membrane protein